MSRVGKNPIAIPKGIQVSIDGRTILVKGSQAELKVPILQGCEAKIEGDELVIREREAGKSRAAWGSSRALANNAIVGLDKGFTKKIEMQGVGYRASVEGSALKLQLGFSHDVMYPVPKGIKIEMEGERKNVIAISGYSKQDVGQVASEIRSHRPPEPYKGKGLRYIGEYIVRKEGKKK